MANVNRRPPKKFLTVDRNELKDALCKNSIDQLRKKDGMKSEPIHITMKPTGSSQ